MNIDHPRPEQIPALRALWSQSFGDPEEYLDDFFAFGFAPDRALVLEEGDQVLSALYWFDCWCGGQKVAYLYAIATDLDHRGKGCGKALIREAHSRLQKKGYSLALLVPGENWLRGYYKTLGYKSFGGIREEKVLAAGPEEKLISCTPAAYMQKRKALLPPGAVEELSGMASFLQTQAEFYCGQDWVLAGRKKQNTFFGMEYLGDKTKLPGIVQSLGVETGTVRTPGQMPYGMYCSLTEPAEKPSYFAFALD